MLLGRDSCTLVLDVEVYSFTWWGDGVFGGIEFSMKSIEVFRGWIQLTLCARWVSSSPLEFLI